MTLLTVKDLEESNRAIAQLHDYCLDIAGMTPYEIGCRAFGLSPLPLAAREQIKVACIPVTAGGGILGDFCHIVAETVEVLAGAQAHVTDGCDVTGFEEALLNKADIVFMADDETFIAYNTHTSVLSDNSDATGRMFAALLDCACGGLDDEVLVLGTGKVGTGACQYLRHQGAVVKWFDIKSGAPSCFDLADETPGWNERSWNYIVDATTAAHLIGPQNVTDTSIVSAPGVPFGVAPDAVQKARLVIHDNLALGVIAMFCQAAGSL